MELTIGDKVIYPNQGVALIEGICKKSIAGRHQEFFILRILSNNSTVLIPVANVANVGLRRLSNTGQLDSLYEILRSEEIASNPDWKDRYKDNVERMKTGSIFEVARVLKNLHFLSVQKALSFRERKMYDRARHLVVSEIAVVRNAPTADVESEVESILGVACQQKIAALPAAV